MTKRLLSILVVLLAGVAVRGQAPTSFAELRGEYANALERIDAAEAKKLEELKTQYAKTLDKGVVYYMRKGDLKSTLALRDERERFEEEGTIPPAISGNGHKKAQKAQKEPSPDGTHGLQPVPWDDVDDGVIRTIKRCRELWLAINQYANRQRLELHEYYAEQLEPVEKRLTRQGKVNPGLAATSALTLPRTSMGSTVPFELGRRVLVGYKKHKPEGSGLKSDGQGYWI